MIPYKGAVVNKPAGTDCVGRCPTCRKYIYATEAEVATLDAAVQEAIKNGQPVEVVCDTCQ